MAPINPKTSPTAAARPVTRKKPAQKPATPEESEEDDPILDLQDIAARVGKEVDVFAEALDQYKDRLQHAETNRDAALQLCTSYREHAMDEVRKLKKQHQVHRMQEMRDTFAKRAQSTFGATGRRRSSESSNITFDQGLKTLKHWQAEADTWALMCAFLNARYPSEEEIAIRSEKLESIGQPHRYSSADDVWQHFVLSDDVAKERHLILKWLEQAADQDSEDVNTLAEELEKRSGRAGGMWTNGWMETRERIKGAKRLRFGKDGAIDVRRSDSTDLLVSSLDPDAPTRQKRTLEQADAASERSMWMTCFELLRRGKPWSEVSDWCVERNQGWKAASMGLTADKELAVGNAGPASGVLWRKMCLVAARSKEADKYEAAVYGLLGGDFDSVKDASRTWNDHVFAHFNHLLMAQYDQYILGKNTLQLPMDFIRSHNLDDSKATSTGTSAQQLVRELAKLPAISKEAQSAMKLLQGSLIGNSFRELCTRVGTAIANTAWKEEPSTVIRPIRQAKSGDTLQEAVIRDDPDSLRIITHILIVMRALERSNFAAQGNDDLDNIIAGYIQLLRVAGKRDMTPLYACIMAEDRCVASLAQVIADDQDPKDSMDFIRLMEIYNIDAIAVIKGQYMYQLDRALAGPPKQGSFSMLEATKEAIYPSRHIKLGGLNTTISQDEEALISGLSVFFLVEGHWTITFDALASTCARLLVEKHFAAARQLIEQLPFETLSQNKSARPLGRAINVMDPIQASPILTDDAPQRAYLLNRMQRESKSYYDMTLLLRAVRSLAHWRKVEHEFASKVPRPASVPVKVKKALEEVSLSMEPVLTGLLVEAKDEEEAATFATIRALYIPEIILSYLTVLTAAGHMVTRDSLLDAMDVSTVIAGSEQLTKAFMDSGRMRELVEMFAEIGKVMLKLGEIGRPRREKRGDRGRSLGIWEIYG